MPTIDVLIPTYRPKREYLTAALECLKRQTFSDWTAFIHDDHTEDSEARAIAQPFLSDPRIRYEESTTRLGIGGNWNACVKKTSSEFVAFLFQDDLWEPHYLQSAVDILKNNPTVGFVSMQHRYQPEGGQELGPIYGGVQAFRSKMIALGLWKGNKCLRLWIDKGLTPNFIGEPSFVVMRRSVMERAGPFLEDMPQFLDSEYWLRLLQISDWFNLAGDFGAFRVHPEAASAKNETSGAGIFDRLRCFGILVGSLQGEERARVVAARRNALNGMVRKFFERKKEGKSVGGAGMMKGIVLRHPFLIGWSVIRYIFGR